MKSCRATDSGITAVCTLGWQFIPDVPVGRSSPHYAGAEVFMREARLLGLAT